jgi:hypothetical protein
MEEVYVVYIKGQNVHKGFSLQGTLRSIDDDGIRKRIKRNYQIEFEELSSRWTSNYWEFKNITDDRDVTLVIEKTTFEDTQI